MADGRCAEEAAATDLSRISGGGDDDADSRVPRERRKNRVADSCAAVGGCCCHRRRRCCCCSSSYPISTTSTTTPPSPRSPLVPTSSSSSPPTTTAHRRRTIGDASDDRRRDGVVRATGDGSRHNDNNENNARRDVANAAVVAAEPPQPPAAAAAAAVVGEAASALVGAKGGRAAAAATVVAAAAPSVVSRLEPAASEDPQRSGECVTDVVVAAGLAADDATSVARPRTEKTRRGRSTSGGDDDDLIAPHDCDDDGDEYNRESRLKDNKHRGRSNDDSQGERAVVVSVGRGRAAASRAASGANGERNSEQQQQQHENVDNETRRGNGQRDDGKSPRNNANGREFRGYADEHEGRRTGTRDGVLLVRRCINNNNINNNNNKNCNTSNSSINNNNNINRGGNNNNNNNNSNTSAGGCYEGGVGVVSVRDSDSNDKARILGSDCGRERSTSGFTVRSAKEVEEDLVSTYASVEATIMQTMQSMQSSDATTTTTTATATATTEMAMNVDGRREDGMMTVEREIDEDGVVVVARLGRPFEGQIRTAEDDDGHVGPCGKKRCADRYDSSESSDSGVAVSCGDCSSSGTSDITEPGSPCSTSSDEGVAGISRVAAPSPLPSLLKLAPTTPPSHSGTRPQWPWTPPLAATACSTYKRLKGEPEAGTLPKAGAADPTARSGAAGGGVGGGVVGSGGGGGVGGGGGGKQQTASGKSHHQQQQQHHHHHHESQGKITEYFKAQIKPQQPKLKKSATDMSLLVAKSSPEFRRPPTVQRNKGGLAKYLGVVLPNGRVGHEREGRTMTVSPPLTKKQSALAPRASAAAKMDKKQQQLCSKVLQGLPLSSDVLAGLPSCKISSLRLTGEASPKPSGASPPVTPTASPVLGEPMMTMDYDEDVATTKPIVNENNNLTNGCATGQEHPMTRLSAGGVFDARKDDAATPRAADDDDDDEDEEDSTTSGLSKTTSSPILSAPTTIRFPARAPEKKGPRGTDSGICRWDKCDGRFECSGALLEHLQAAHINTQQGGDNFVCHWQGCKVQGRTSCSRRWLERHVLSHGGNKPFRCIVDGCGSRFSSQTALERHVNSHFNQPETSSSSGRRSCESGGKLVRRNGKKLRYRRQPWSARLFDYIDTGVMEGLQHRLVELAKTRTQGRLAETPGNSMALTSQVLARRVELDGKAKVLLRWYPRDIEPDEWVLESEVQSTKHIGIRSAATTSIDEVSLVLYPAVSGGTPPQTRTKQRRKPVKNS